MYDRFSKISVLNNTNLFTSVVLFSIIMVYNLSEFIMFLVKRENVRVDETYPSDFIALIEEKYDCRFIAQACINQRKDATGNWLNSPWIIFYSNKEPHPQGSKWLAFGTTNKFVVTDGQSVPNHELGMCGYYNPETGEAVYSTYKWDNVWDKSGTFSVDGGNDYIKITGTPPKDFIYGQFHLLPDSSDDFRDAGLYFQQHNE